MRAFCDVLDKLFNFRNYSNNVRPVRNASLPVPVKLGLTLTQIFDMVSQLNRDAENMFHLN